MRPYRGFIKWHFSLAAQRSGYLTGTSHLAQSVNLPLSSSTIHQKLQGAGREPVWLWTVGSTAGSRQMHRYKL